MDMIRSFLVAPSKNRDEFWENDELIWIDWREYEESIIKYFNEKLPPEDQIKFECKEREIDIVLEKNGVKIEIPYADEYTDRDTTLRNILSQSIRFAGIWTHLEAILLLFILD